MANALNVIRNNSLMCQQLRSDINNLTKSKEIEVNYLKFSIQMLEAKVTSLTEELNSLKTSCFSSNVEEEPVVEEAPASVEEEPVVEEAPASVEEEPVVEEPAVVEEENLEMNVE